MIFLNTSPTQNSLFNAIRSAYRKDETMCVQNLLSESALSPDALNRIHQKAEELVIETQKNRKKQGGLDSFLNHYDLSSEEGIALMCMAEALLRIPDSDTIDRLISDKLSTADWEQHINKSGSLFVNAATWSLLLTGKVYASTLNNQKSLGATLKRLFSRTSSTLIRPIIMQGMKIIGKQFVMGRTIEEAIKRAQKLEAIGYRYSYDMLGEAARTAEDAEKYYASYVNAIDAIGNAAPDLNPIHGPGISIKLSALHPRYEYNQRERVFQELAPKLLALALKAKEKNIGITVDAEEADRLELSLEIFEKVFSNPALNGWEGFGLAVQAYQKRAPFVIDWLADLSKQHKRRIMIRLIKGAYWDTEIKVSQVLGLEGYPVFTRKHSTDISYIACAKKILTYPTCFYPQFGTHNAHSVAVILELMGTRTDYEFQCLHGMGQPLYNQIVKNNIPCRIYAPVGSHKDLLGYLVRRLLENGANTSFINRIVDENTSMDKIITDPISYINKLSKKPHTRIPLPKDIFMPTRQNSKGMDLSNYYTQIELKTAMDGMINNTWESGPIINGNLITNKTTKTIACPSQTDIIVGHVTEATAEAVEEALQVSKAATDSWGKTPVETRAKCLEQAADLLEKAMPTFITLLCREGGKQITDCVSEIRETIDFCRYYAAQARHDFVPMPLQSPTGEYNELSLHPRGVIVCISPWNFPLAIFAGQIVAALVTGNTVIAKPAEQTPLVAAEMVKLLHSAGIPKNALQLLPGQGEIVGATLVADNRVSCVMFTGSTDTAKHIQKTLANRSGPIVPLIAETGGQNVMIVDSSALPEQVVADILSSSFNSAGQRCSALRVLYVQKEIANRVLDMLKGAMSELKLGDPSLLSTDIGPVIDKDALMMLQQHVTRMKKEAKLIHEIQAPSETKGYFFGPAVFELDSLSTLTKEIFGPILHVIRYNANSLDQVLNDIIETGYGLTLGIHSRIDDTVNYIKNKMPVGNIYVNRNIIGAVVGVQPFGGEGLSGTGPKAGGPHYLPRLCVERAISINTTAAGGDTTLISLSEDE